MVIDNWEELINPENQKVLDSGGKQTEKFLMKAMAALQK